MRWVLLAATIPIAIAANAARVTLMGVIGEYRTDLAQGFIICSKAGCCSLLALIALFNRGDHA